MSKSLKLSVAAIVCFFSVNLLSMVGNIYLQFEKAKTLYSNNFTLSFSPKGVRINDTLLGLFEGDYFLSISVCTSVALIGILLWLTYKIYGNYSILALREVENQNIILLISSSALILFIILEKLMYSYIPGDYFDTNAAIASAKSIPLLMLQAILLSPIIEELLFRGILFNFLLEKMNALSTIICITIIFTLLHQQYGTVELTLLFCIALVSGYLRYLSNSIYPSILFHIINNSLPFFFYYLV